MLKQQPHHVSSVRFLNVEGQAEAGDITNRLEQVTLFRTHQVTTPPAQRVDADVLPVRSAMCLVQDTSWLLSIEAS